MITTGWTCEPAGRRVLGYLDHDSAVQRSTDAVRRWQHRLQTCRAYTAAAEGLAGRRSAVGRYGALAQWWQQHCYPNADVEYPNADVEPGVRDTAWHLIAAGAG